MNAPFLHPRHQLRLADLTDPGERQRIERFVAGHPDATPFHRLAWLEAVAAGTSSPATIVTAEAAHDLTALVPLSLVHSPIFGRMLASSGFAVSGGILAEPGFDLAIVVGAIEELAQRLSCTTIELRGGVLPEPSDGWTQCHDSHAGFVAALARDDEAQLLAIPRKQRAEVRKGLSGDLTVTVGSGPDDRAAHYAVYAQSVRNLGTPVFPRALFDATLDRFGADADILTVSSATEPVASVLSLYHTGAVMPYWGGGTSAARRLRANDRMYYELMLHARRRGCHTFDFGRSKVASGAYDYKRTWGFEPVPLSYASWTAPGAARRDASPVSAKNSRLVGIWKRLPQGLANRFGPVLAQGLG